MFRSLLLGRNLNSSIKLYRTYLSQEFKNVMNEEVPLENVSKQKIDELHVNKRTSPVRADFMARTLQNKEEQRADLAEELSKLRNQSDAFDILGSTSHAVIKNFTLSEAIPELLDILKDKLKYGIFVDKFSGSYLMDHLLEKQQFMEAMKVGVEHYIQDDYDSQLVCALSLKAGYECLKRSLIAAIKPPKVEEVDPKDIIKVRVKYIRNPNPYDKSNDLRYMIGITLIKMAQNAPEEIKKSMQLPGFLLTSNYEKAQEILNSKSTLDKDVVEACLEFIKDDPEIPADITEALNMNLASSKSFLEEKLMTFLNEAMKKEESVLIAEQKENAKKWAKQLETMLQKAIAHRNKLLRLKNVDEILAEMKRKRKQLWYFELEESIELDIAKKIKYYPRRWFGKRKKPRVVDENYVPPELR